MDYVNSVVVVAAICVSVSLALLAFAFTARPGGARADALRNLGKGFNAPESQSGLQVSGGGLVGLAKALTPLATLRWIDSLLARAGRPAAWPIERVIVLKVVLTGLAVMLGFLIVSAAPSARMVGLGLFVIALAWATPELLLLSRAQERKQNIQEKLPDALDQLTIAVEAGLGFEAALAHVARHSDGPLSEELIRTLQDIQVGQPRRTAYADLAARTRVQDLGRFVRAINQAEANGISIGRVLGTQSREMRIKRRQRAEEKAMKIPVKVVFPLILFILPVLFIVIIGPAVLSVLNSLNF